MKRISVVIFVLMAMGLTSYADDYLPLLREGVKWVYLEKYFSMTQDFSEITVEPRFYTIELKGDTVVDGNTYKKCYRYSDTEWDYDDIYCSKSKPVALLREEGQVVYAYNANNVFVNQGLSDYYQWAIDDWKANGSKDIKLYEFTENEHFKLVGYKFFMNQYSNVYLFDGCFDGLFVEGVGFDSECWGDMLIPLYLGPATPSITHNQVGLHHVEDADGNIIYKGAAYLSLDDNSKFDHNGDGLVDVDDVNALINYILNK